MTTTGALLLGAVLFASMGAGQIIYTGKCWIMGLAAACVVVAVTINF